MLFMFQLLQYDALRWVVREYWKTIIDMNLQLLYIFLNQ